MVRNLASPKERSGFVFESWEVTISPWISQILGLPVIHGGPFGQPGKLISPASVIKPPVRTLDAEAQ